MSNMMLQTIGRTVPATFVAMARQGIFFIPLVWLLSLSPLGLLGVQMAQSVSDLLTLAAAVPIQLYVCLLYTSHPKFIKKFYAAFCFFLSTRANIPSP